MTWRIGAPRPAERSSIAVAAAERANQAACDATDGRLPNHIASAAIRAPAAAGVADPVREECRDQCADRAADQVLPGRRRKRIPMSGGIRPGGRRMPPQCGGAGSGNRLGVGTDRAEEGGSEGVKIRRLSARSGSSVEWSSTVRRGRPARDPGGGRRRQRGARPAGSLVRGKRRTTRPIPHSRPARTCRKGRPPGGGPSCIRGPVALHRPPPADEVEQEHHQRQHEQQVNQPPGHVEHTPAKEPCDQKDHR